MTLTQTNPSGIPICTTTWVQPREAATTSGLRKLSQAQRLGHQSQDAKVFREGIGIELPQKEFRNFEQFSWCQIFETLKVYFNCK